MDLPEVNPCFCFSLKTGCYIIGWVKCIVVALNLIHGFPYMLVSVKMIVVNLLNLTVSIFLLIGTYQDKADHLLPFILFGGLQVCVFLVISVYMLFGDLSFAEVVEWLLQHSVDEIERALYNSPIFVILIGVLATYSVLVVACHCIQLMQRRNAESLPP